MSSQQTSFRGQSEESVQSSHDENVQSPYVYRRGRRYLRDVPHYPLPVDLLELNRQVLRSHLLLQVFGKPYSATLKKAPEQILELICGPAVWSMKCDEYLKGLGYQSAMFTGLDLAPVAPDLSKFGVNWHFVQHNLRKPPMPFAHSTFDLIIVNDGTTVMESARDIESNPITSLRKYLKPGGVVETCELDYIYRCLQPGCSFSNGRSDEDALQAKETATYVVGTNTAFSKSQNPYIRDYNTWVEKAFSSRHITPTPCATMSLDITSEAQNYEEVGSRRVAIPFSKMRWENEVGSATAEMSERTSSKSRRSVDSRRSKGKGKSSIRSSATTDTIQSLSPDQIALRRTALDVTVGLMESLEPWLIEESGKSQVEWDRWWGNMMTALYQHDGLSGGECLEVGIWWARKAMDHGDE